MSSIGKISLDLNINNKKFNRQVDNIEKQTKKSFNSMSVAVGNIMSQLAQKALGSIGNFVSDSINKGSELTELENVVESVFTSMADKVDAFSKSALDTYGLTEKQAKRMVGTFGAMSKSFGYSEEQAYNMSTALAGLSGDVASFYNLDIEEAYTKMKSVFTGETESLKELGVVMTQAALDEFALANGFGNTTSKMSEQEKVALRLAFVQDKLSTATGDVVRTQDSWANQTRKLSGQIDSFKTAIGQGLINVLTPVIKVINTIMAKLVQLANAFKSFTEMIMGKRSGGAGSAMKEVAEAAGDAADATGGIEDAAAGAAGSAKEAQKSLMGFDELNKLQKNDTSSGAGGGGASSDFDFDFGETIKEEEKKADAAISKLKSKLKELFDLFKKGFEAGLGDDFENSFSRIKEHVRNISNSIKEIIADTDVVKSVNDAISNVVYGIGQVLGSIASIITSIYEMIFGGYDNYLVKDVEFIKESITGIFDEFGNTGKILGDFSQAIASIFEVFRGDTAKQIASDLIGIFVNSNLGITKLSLKIGNDVIDTISGAIIENKDKIKDSLEKTLEPISKITSTLNESVKSTFEKIFSVYEEKIKPAFESLKEGLSMILSSLLDAYNNYLAPVLDEIAVKFEEVFGTKVQPSIENVIDVLGKVIELIGWLWKTVLAPLISWIISNIIPVIAPIIKILSKSIITLFGLIADTVSGTFETLGGLIDFIIGIFTGDWERAWGGIKSIFLGIWKVIKASFLSIWEVLKSTVLLSIESINGNITLGFNTIKDIIGTIWGAIKGIITSIWDGIKLAISTIVNSIANVISSGFNWAKDVVSRIMNDISTVIMNVFTGIWNFMKGIINTILGGIEKLVNGVISGLNLMIDAMNKLKFNVPNWVPAIGGNSFGLKIPRISSISLPRLAEGGYVRANQPQPVIIGDNKREGEIVSPESKILDITLKALEQFFGRLKEVGYSSSGNGEVGDIIIPIYLDGSLLDEVIVTAQQRRNLRSGGR